MRALRSLGQLNRDDVRDSVQRNDRQAVAR